MNPLQLGGQTWPPARKPRENPLPPGTTWSASRSRSRATLLSHEVRTDQFIKTAGVSRVGDRFQWILGIVRAYMGRPTTIQLLQQSLEMLDDEEALEVMMPKLRQLDAHGALSGREH